MAVEKTKPFWMSTTIWINFAGIIAVVLAYVLNLELVKDREVVALLLAVLNIINRFRATREPVKLSL